MWHPFWQQGQLDLLEHGRRAESRMTPWSGLSPWEEPFPKWRWDDNGGQVGRGSMPHLVLHSLLHSFKEKGSTWCPALCCSFQEGQGFLQDARQSWAGQGMNSGKKFPCLTPWHPLCSTLTLSSGIANLAVPSIWSALPLITGMADLSFLVA